MQRDARIRCIHRLPAPPRFGVDRTACGDKGRHVGDGVVQHGTGRGSLQVQRLVEVGRACRVDREQRDAPQIIELWVIDAHARDGGCRLVQHRIRESLGELEFSSERRERGAERCCNSGEVGLSAQLGQWHRLSVGGGCQHYP